MDKSLEIKPYKALNIRARIGAPLSPRGEAAGMVKFVESARRAVYPAEAERFLNGVII